MAKLPDAAKQRANDERQVSQHYVHWGVKTLVGLAVGVVGGLVWLAWVLITK